MAERILVVEDDPTVRDGLAFHLNRLGYCVATAGDGPTAIAALQESPADVIVVDLILPGEMDGIQVLQMARRVAPQTCAIIITGYPSTETTIRALRLGASDYVIKPFDLGHLGRVVTGLVQRLRGDRQAAEARGHADRALEAVRALGQATRRLTSFQEFLAVALESLLVVVPGASLAWCFLLEGDDSLASGLTLVATEGGRRVVLGGCVHAGPVPRILPADLCGEGTCECIRLLAGTEPEALAPTLVSCTRLQSLGETATAGEPCHMTLPLVVQGRAVGLLNVAKPDYAAFSPEEVTLLEILADQCAIGMAMANLHVEVEAALRELRESQQRAVLLGRLRAMGELASGVAHDFNNLLTAIVGSAQLLHRGETDPRRLEELGIIERAAQDGAETVRRILEFTRVRRDREGVPVDLRAVVLETVDLTRARWRDSAQARGATIHLHLDLQPVTVIPGNPAELREMVINLILNAVDAMPSGGTLTLRVRATGGAGEAENGGVGEWEKGGMAPLHPFTPSPLHVVIEVSDTGVGMAPDVLARIFDPFFTTKEGSGSGLGLSVAYGIVQRHDGDILVNSARGEGTTFTVRFPVAPGREGSDSFGMGGQTSLPVRLRQEQAGLSPVPAQAAAADMPAPAARILVVDDEPRLAQLLQSLLETRGHRVVAATGGAEAIELLRAGAFDLVLTDLGMPEVSGWDLAREARRIAPGVPVVLVTGWGAQIGPEEATQAGVARVIQKPYALESIQRVIADLLSGPRDKDTEKESERGG